MKQKKAHFRNLQQIPGPTARGNFLTKFILCCVTLDLSDNLTEMGIVKNSIATMNLFDLLEITKSINALY